jgi:hypothetical protein
MVNPVRAAGWQAKTAGCGPAKLIPEITVEELIAADLPDGADAPRAAPAVGPDIPRL